MYLELYNLIHSVLVVDGGVTTPYIDLIVELMTATACVAVIAIPFVVVYCLVQWLVSVVNGR